VVDLHAAEPPAETLCRRIPHTCPAAASHVGRAVCATCHAEEDRWRDSHHSLAMQEANAATVLGDFNGQTYTYLGIESRFFQRDGKFLVTTDGPDGKLADYPVKYTFGVWPLQQYLVEFPGGRLQALSIAWDARGKGRRPALFHLYRTSASITKTRCTGPPVSELNLQCAAHSTDLKKGYDAASNRYQTSFKS
jgi:hypothetical protein